MTAIKIIDDHAELANIGTNTHAQIDTHIAANPDGTAQGQLGFWDSSLSRWVNAEASELFWDDTNKWLGIKTTTPKAPLTIGLTTNSVEDRGVVLGIGDDKIEFVMSRMYSGFGVKMEGRVAEGTTKLNYFARQASGSWPASPVMGIGSDNRVSVYNKGLYNINAFTTATLEIGYSGNMWYGNYVFRIGSDDTHFGDWLTMDNAGRLGIGYDASMTGKFNVNGNVGVGTKTPAASALVDLTSTTGALLLSRMTTAQRNALTAVNGLLLYNTSVNQTQCYENGAWRQL